MDLEREECGSSRQYSEVYSRDDEGSGLKAIVERERIDSDLIY